jgi:nickel-dependent lactate racemase
MDFDYGKTGIEIEVDPKWNITVIKAKKQKLIKNPIQAIKKAIKKPLGTPPLQAIIEKKRDIKTVCIVVSDATRPVPTHLMLEPLIQKLNEAGIDDSQITILLATGLHRASNKEEINRIVGEDLVGRITVKNHVAKDENSMKYFGTIDNIPIYINRIYCNSDLKILTGYVEPHFFFGFSGGRKSIVPGIAGAQTILANHSAVNIASIASRFGKYQDNPMALMSTKISKMVGVDFVLNVCINEVHQITQIAAGDLEKVHNQLVKYQLKNIFSKISEPFDIVVCGNGGYPLDINMYQAVKSMAIGELAVKAGGTIISVNECSDGIGIGQDDFKNLLFSEMKPKEIYDKILRKHIIVPDQWEIQVLTRIMMKAEIYIISRLNENEIGNIGLKYAKTTEIAIEQALKKYGRNANILILPNGPLILPQLA